MTLLNSYIFRNQRKLGINIQPISIVADNLNKLVVTRNQGRGKKNRMANYTNAYAFYERIWTPLKPGTSYVVRKAADLPLHTFLPGRLEAVVLRSIMIKIVKRILWETITVVKSGLGSTVDLNFHHQFTSESAQLTKIVS